MASSDIDLSALLAARICHDLSNPLGAASNGVELLEVSDVNSMPEIVLIRECVDSANARIGFFRLAYGIATKDTEVSVPWVSKVTELYFANRPLNLSWSIGPSYPRRLIRILLLLLQCIDTALPKGGDVSISQTDTLVVLTVNGDHQLEPPLWDHLQGHADGADVQAVHVHFLLARHYLEIDGLNLTLHQNNDGLTVELRRFPNV